MHYTSKPHGEESQPFTVLVDVNDSMDMRGDDFANYAIDMAGAHNIEDITWKVQYVNNLDDVMAISITGYPADTITHPDDMKNESLKDTYITEFSVEVTTTLQDLNNLQGESIEEKLANQLMKDGIPQVDIDNIQYRMCGCTSKIITLRVWGWFKGTEESESETEKAMA